MSLPDFNTAILARSVLTQAHPKAHAPITLETSILDVLFDATADGNAQQNINETLPSQAKQLSYFQGDITKANWIAKNTSDETVLAKFAKHRSVIVKRTVAENTTTPTPSRDLLRQWAVRNGDQYILDNLAEAQPLLELLLHLADATLPTSYAEQRLNGLDIDKVAERIKKEATEQLARVAMQIKDGRIHAGVLAACVAGKTGLLTLTEIVTHYDKMVKNGKVYQDYAVDQELRNQIDQASNVTYELLKIARPRIKDERGDTHKLESVDAKTRQVIIDAANKQPSTGLRAGYSKHGLSIREHWPAVESLAARVGSIDNIDLELRAAAMKLAHYVAARPLLLNDTISLTTDEITTLINDCTNLEVERYSYTVKYAARQTLIHALDTIPLTPKQRVVAYIASEEKPDKAIKRTLTTNINPIDMAFVKELTQLPEVINQMAEAGDTTTRVELIIDLIRFATAGTTIDGELYQEVYEDGEDDEAYSNPAHWSEEEIEKRAEIKAEEKTAARIELALPEELLIKLIDSVPLPSLLELCQHAGPKSRLNKALATRLNKAFGKRADIWKLFIDISKGWEGSFYELVDTTLTMVGLENPEQVKTVKPVVQEEDFSYELRSNNAAQGCLFSL